MGLIPTGNPNSSIERASVSGCELMNELATVMNGGMDEFYSQWKP
jgi:hypothetical protein